MKKRLLLTVLMVLSLIDISAQRIVIHLKDGTTKSYQTSKIEKIVTDETSEDENEGYIKGTWYLGIYKAGTTVIHFDGGEYFAFDGNQLVWGGSGEGTNTFTLEYSADNKTFTGKNVKKPSEVKKFEILEYTSSLLVLRHDGADRYFYPTKEEARNAEQESEQPNHKETNNINTIMSYAYGYTKSSSTPMGKHYEGKRGATSEDIAWLMDPDNEPAAVANLPRWVGQPVKLYPYGDPSPADVNQHAIGDCSACSVFASLAYLYPDFIKSIITDNGNKTYTVKMFDAQGKPIEVCVSNKILSENNGKIGQVTGKNNVVTWATILEKAFMKWETRFQIDNVEGIGTEFLAPLFTGDGESFAIAPNTLHTSELKTLIEYVLQQGMITIGGFNVGGIKVGQLETVTAHAFAFMLSNNVNAIFCMRNPWGTTSADGVLEIPDKRSVVKTIDVRAVMPGAAAPYLRKNVGPYNPPKFTIMPTDIGVSERLMMKARSIVKNNELW